MREGNPNGFDLSSHLIMGSTNKVIRVVVVLVSGSGDALGGQIWYVSQLGWLLFAESIAIESLFVTFPAVETKRTNSTVRFPVKPIH